MNLDQLQAASKERHKNKSKEFTLAKVVALVVKKEPKPKITFKEKQIKAKAIAVKIDKIPIIPPPIIINKSTLTLQDLNFYEVPKGKLSKPKKRYQKRKEALAEFEEKRKRIRAISQLIQSKL